MATTTTLTIPQYSVHLKERGIKKMNRQNVFKAVDNNRLDLLPGVIKINKVGRYTLLEVTT